MKVLLTLILASFCALNMNAQELVYQTFKDRRVINTHSTETLERGKLDFRIGHRFGDLGGETGGWQTFYGLENAADVLFGLEYGVNDNFMVGLSRTAGSSDLLQNIHGLAKIKLVSQDREGKNPFSVAVLAISSVTTMEKNPAAGTLSFFEKPAHRVSYHLSAILAKKFSQYFSMQVNGGMTYRNLVAENDKNILGSLGAAMRLQISKSFGLLVDATFPFSEIRKPELGYYFPLAFGLEWDTGGGHVFQMNFTNSTGLAETDYIPYTRSNWLEGEFRFGFTISRLFTL